MRQFLITLAALAASTQAALAQLPPPTPPATTPAPAPEFAVVDTLLPDQGTIQLAQDKVVPTTQQKPVTETVIINGQPTTITKSITVTVMMTQKVKKSWSANKDQAYDHAGNPLTRETLFQRLKAGDTVLLLGNGQKLSPAFQKLLSKEAVVLVTGASP